MFFMWIKLYWEVESHLNLLLWHFENLYGFIFLLYVFKETPVVSLALYLFYHPFITYSTDCLAYVLIGEIIGIVVDGVGL